MPVSVSWSENGADYTTAAWVPESGIFRCTLPPAARQCEPGQRHRADECL